MGDSYSRSTEEYKQRIYKEDIARLKFAGEIRYGRRSLESCSARVLTSHCSTCETNRARQMEHDVKNPNRPFRPFKRKILPHLLDTSDISSDVGSITSSRSQFTTSPARRASAQSPKTLQRPATSSIELDPFMHTQRFNESLDGRIAFRTSDSTKSNGSMRSTRRLTSSNSNARRGTANSLDAGWWMSDARSGLSTPETPPGAAFYRIKGTNYAKAKQKYGHLISEKRSDTSGGRDAAETTTEQQPDEPDNDEQQQQQQQQGELNICNSTAMAMIAEQQKALMKLENLEKEVLEERNGRLQVQQELEELKKLLETTLKITQNSQTPATNAT